jgi:hypothetical protein
MPTLKDAVLGSPPTGPCKIDVELAAALFDKQAFISKWGDEYRLVRQNEGNDVTPFSLKVTIYKNDALALIDKLNLYEVQSQTFAMGSTFYDPRFK